MIKIGNKRYSPEEYASFWGCEPAYDTPPRIPNDGIYFYDFGSERLIRTKHWLESFVASISRTISSVTDKEDINGLIQLKNHVQGLIYDKGRKNKQRHLNQVVNKPKTMRCNDCGGQMQWCNSCQQYTKSCCVPYDT